MMNSNGISRQSPLWVAAYSFNKLKKAQVLEIDIPSCVEKILQEMDVVSYRVLGHLLLGVVRIYSQKVEYLLLNNFEINTENHAHVGMLCMSITIPRTLQLDAFDLEIPEVDGESHIAHPDDITLKDKEVPCTTDVWQLSQTRFEDCNTQFEGFEFGEIIRSSDHPLEEDLAHLMDLDFLKPNSPNNLLASKEIPSISSPKEPVNLFEENSEDQTVQETVPYEDKIHEESTQEESVDVPQSNIRGSSIRGATTQELMLISAPAVRERARVSRKRKTVFDATTRLSNEEHKRSLNDTSDLVAGRGNIRRTLVAKQREYRIFRLPGAFYEPLFPSSSPQYCSLFSKKKIKIPDSLKIVETQEKFDGSKSQTAGSPEKMAYAPQTPPLAQMPYAPQTSPPEQMAYAPQTPPMEKMVCAPQTSPLSPHPLVFKDTPGVLDVPESQTSGNLEHIATAAQTPPLCQNMILGLVEPPERTEIQSPDKLATSSPHESMEKEQTSEGDDVFDLVEEESFGSFEREQCSTRDDDLDLLNEEANSSETEDSESSTGLSERTRKVATHLNKSFQDLTKQKEKDVINFSRVCSGRNRTESAKLFYEILVLKSKDYVDVKQDSAYGEIAIKKLPKLDETLS